MMIKYSLMLSLFILFSVELPAQKLKTITRNYPNDGPVKSEYTVLKKKKHIKHGDYKTYFQNGQIKISGSYDQNRRVGAWLEYDAQGSLRRTKTYQLGKLKSDKKQGIWKEVLASGKFRSFNHDTQEYIFPQINHQVAYPREGRDKNISGTVKVKAVLNENCEPVELRVVQSLGADFDAEALAGVQAYLKALAFYPYDCPGFTHTFNINFSLL